MKKYAMIAQASIMENLQYVANIVMGFGSFFVILFINIQLWNYMYADSGTWIAGYTRQQMIWYVIITETIWFSGWSSTVTSQAVSDVRGGNIACLVNKPYHYALYIIAKYTGEWSIRLPLYAFLAAVTGIWLVGPLPGFRAAVFPVMLLGMALGITIHAVFRLCISLLSFWIEDSTPFQWLYSKLILVVGTLFPVEIFPTAFRPLFKLTPVYTVCYGPAKLIIDFSLRSCLEILLAQFLYLLAAGALLFYIYGKGVKKLHVNGGEKSASGMYLVSPM